MQQRDYEFYGAISEQTLRNYLSRSIVLSYVDGWRYKNQTRAETIAECRKLIFDAGAKYIARAGCSWIPDIKEENDYQIWAAEIKAVHKVDPDVIFEACVFETAYRGFENFKIPASVFKAFNMPYEDRNFRYEDMLFPDGTYVDHWEPGGSVPDITRLETQMFFYWRACLYIDLGFEAIHYGQVMLIGEHDRNFACWTRVMSLVREYARLHARRRFVLFNAHTHGIVDLSGKLMFDFHCYPCRPVVRVEAIPHLPTEENPQTAELISGWGNSIYNRSMGGETHSGWKCKSLPYFVEIDNYGCQPPEMLNRPVDYYPWGYDEVSWFANQPKSYRMKWIEYAVKWLRTNDDAGYFEMLGVRTCRLYDENLPEKLTHGEFYYAPSERFNDIDIIKAAWQLQ